MPLIVPGKSLTAKLPDWLGRLRDLLKTALEARKLLPIAFLMLLGFLVLMAWDGYSTTSELLSAQAYVQRTHQVLHEMDGVEDSIQDAREAWLHYILTPEKEDIANFEDAQVRTWTQLDHLLNLDPEHQAAVRKVQDLVRDEFRQLQADLRINYTKLIYHSQQNDEKHERVREAIQQFKDNEERVLRERSEAAQVRSREITRSVSTRIGLFSVFMGVLFLLVMHDSKRLRVAEQTALSAQTKLENSLLQLKSESENSRLLNQLQTDFQICVSPAEAFKVAASYLERLVPESAGTVFSLSNVQEALEAMASWPSREMAGLHQVFSREDCCAVRGGRLHTHLDSPKGLECRHFNGEIPPAYICIPLSALGETLGVLHLSAATPDPFTESRMVLIQQIGEYAALRLANLKLKETLQDQSIRDPLTGLYNRRFLDTRLEQELRRAGDGKGTGIGLIMADLDGFKLFNDTFGHEAGDLVLKEVASLLRRCVRSEDIVCRYGGEEFLIAIPDSSPESVCERAEQMRTAVAKLDLEMAGRPLGKITGSFGVSFCNAGDTTSEALMREADEALYVAKRSGCDCVRLSDSVSQLMNPSKAEPEQAGASKSKSAARRA
ncbi:MAG TPA: diguanylate cyclase [Candidatus Angelobacter sp.]|nr:diguanylate cyclase [Candidatus Angelobacter sp.]